MKTYINYFIQYIFFCLLFNNSFANLFSLTDFSPYINFPALKQFVTYKHESLTDNLVILKVKFSGIYKSKTCIGSIVDTSDNNTIKELNIFTTRYCLTYAHNNLDINKIKSISIFVSNNNQNTEEIYTFPLNEKVFNLNKNTSIAINNNVTKTIYSNSSNYINHLKIGNITYKYSNDIVFFNIQQMNENNETISYPNQFSGFNISKAINTEYNYLYFLPEFVKINNKISLKLFPINTTELAAIIYMDYTKKYDNSYYIFRETLIYSDIRPYTFDSFIKEDIGGPLLKCTMLPRSITETNQYERKFSTCSLIAINTGIRVIKPKIIENPAAILQAFNELPT